jgi:hypothetical protein
MYLCKKKLQEKEIGTVFFFFRNRSDKGIERTDEEKTWEQSPQDSQE